MRLIHFSNKIINKIINKKQTSEFSIKPKGLWISDENSNCGWEKWCIKEGYNLDNLKYKYLIELKSNANILIISNLKQFDKFEEQYNKKIIKGVKSYFIDWLKVSKKYSGIIISPYFWERRFVPWYYGWDVASGCIWNKKVIYKFSKIESDK